MSVNDINETGRISTINERLGPDRGGYAPAVICTGMLIPRAAGRAISAGRANSRLEQVARSAKHCQFGPGLHPFSKQPDVELARDGSDAGDDCLLDRLASMFRTSSISI